MRHFRGSRGGRRGSMRPVIMTFKKVLDYAPASRTVDTVHQFNIAAGVDSVAAGQTTPTDVNVPTGSMVRFVEIQFSASNLVSQSEYFWATIQIKHTGQGVVSGRVVGGNPQRNQVFRQLQFQLGQNQSSNHVWKWKVPPKFQRLREGDVMVFTLESDVAHNSAVQIIYKFLR